MAIQIGAKPDSGFDDPIGLLTDCHRRIEHFLSVLSTVSREAPASAPLSPDHARAVESALHYFRTSGPRHTADEEESLFPRLRRPSEKVPELARLDALESDHAEAEELHWIVDALFREWLAKGRLRGSEAQQLITQMSRLESIYFAHIRAEEDAVFPYAAATLSAPALAEIGAEFRRRRNL